MDLLLKSKLEKCQQRPTFSDLAQFIHTTLSPLANTGVIAAACNRERRKSVIGDGAEKKPTDREREREREKTLAII